MNKLILSAAFLLLFTSVKSQAPSGLDSIIVEKYYIAEANDTNVNSIGGILSVNSVTYRIYVDMKPGYKFEAAYGVDVAPAGVYTNPGDHELRISTTTLFFNNEDRGDMTPGFSKANAAHNTVMLDSWFSVGAACSGNFGVLKADDNGTANVVNADGVLQSTNAAAGIPLTTQDGLLTGTPQAVTFVGFSAESAMLNNQNDGTNGPVISTYNGSWASLNGSVGPTADNKILIAQITTNGQLCFLLNIQLGTPTPGGVENWVASGPVGSEATHASLTYCSAPVGIAPVNNPASLSFSTYPNPVNDVFTIDINKTTTSTDNNSYSIYSIDGKIILSKKLGMIQGKHQEKIDMSSFAPGIYFVELSLDGVRSTRKIIKN